MNVPAPHFYLFSEANRGTEPGHWKFVLKSADGAAILEAEDTEPDLTGERAELLAVVRGLEALDQPSQVTLMTPSRYVHRGMSYGMKDWERNDWTWERFGEAVPVRNSDLWRRLSSAARIHRVERRSFRLDGPHTRQTPPPHVEQAEPSAAVERPTRRARPGRRLLARIGRLARNRSEAAWLACAQLGTCLLPLPWLD